MVDNVYLGVAKKKQLCDRLRKKVVVALKKNPRVILKDIQSDLKSRGTDMSHRAFS